MAHAAPVRAKIPTKSPQTVRAGAAAWPAGSKLRLSTAEARERMSIASTDR